MAAVFLIPGINHHDNLRVEGFPALRLGSGGSRCCSAVAFQNPKNGDTI